MRVLDQAAIAHFGNAEDALDHVERMLRLGAHLRLASVHRLFTLTQRTGALCLLVGEVFCNGRMRADDLTLSGVRGITPQPDFVLLVLRRGRADDGAVVDLEAMLLQVRIHTQLKHTLTAVFRFTDSTFKKLANVKYRE